MDQANVSLDAVDLATRSLVDLALVDLNAMDLGDIDRAGSPRGESSHRVSDRHKPRGSCLVDRATMDLVDQPS